MNRYVCWLALLAVAAVRAGVRRVAVRLDARPRREPDPEDRDPSAEADAGDHGPGPTR